MALKPAENQAKGVLDLLKSTQEVERKKPLGIFQEKIRDLEAKILKLKSKGLVAEESEELTNALAAMKTAQVQLKKKEMDLRTAYLLEDRDPEKIPLNDRFNTIWAMKPEDLENLTLSMKIGGYDRSQPVIIGRWNGGEALIDGHTRRAGAIAAGLGEIPCLVRDFSSEQDAYEYAVNVQLTRRNLTDSDRLTFLITKKALSANLGSVPEPQGKGRPREGINREDVARILKVSSGTAGKFLAVLKAEGEVGSSVRNQVLSGVITINQAAKLLSEEKENGFTANIVNESERATKKTAEPTHEPLRSSQKTSRVSRIFIEEDVPEELVMSVDLKTIQAILDWMDQAFQSRTIKQYKDTNKEVAMIKVGYQRAMGVVEQLAREAQRVKKETSQ